MKTPKLVSLLCRPLVNSTPRKTENSLNHLGVGHEDWWKDETMLLYFNSFLEMWRRWQKQLLVICLCMVNEPVFNMQLLLKMILIRHICYCGSTGTHNFQKFLVKSEKTLHVVYYLHSVIAWFVFIIWLVLFSLIMCPRSCCWFHL